MTKWREIGNFTLDTWTQTLKAAGSPLFAASSDAYEAAKPHTGLCLAMLRVESQFGLAFNANRASNKNYLNLRPPAGGGYLAFPTAVDGIRAWRDRITSPTYKEGIYARTGTIEELIHVYAPSFDNNNEAEYVASIKRDLGRWGISLTGEPIPEQGPVVFGNVPKPPIIELICSKPFEGAGFYRVSPRDNVGVCEHITDGRGSVEFYHQFFSTGGERAADALVDFVIGRDGRIAMLNDWRGTRAPWANGNKLGLEGDGPRFLQTFGVAGIDQRLVSIEHEGTAAEDWTPAMWSAAVALDAWLFDQMGIRYDTYPIHQKYGVVTHMLHSEFTNKGGNALDECPGRFLKQRITRFQSEVRAVMKAHQSSVAGVPSPNPFAKPSPITWKRGDTGTFDLNGTPALAFVLQVKCTATKVTPRVSATNKKAVGPDLKKGDTAIAIGSYHGGPEQLPFVVLDGGGRVPYKSVRPLVPLPPT